MMLPRLLLKESSRGRPRVGVLPAFQRGVTLPRPLTVPSQQPATFHEAEPLCRELAVLIGGSSLRPNSAGPFASEAGSGCVF